MNETKQAALKQRYQQAIDQFIDKIKDDVNIIALIVSGSVAYDVIWEKSDVDMTVIVRDQQLKSENLSIIEEGITFNLYLVQRSTFVRGLAREIGGSFLQSYISNGKIVYTSDESLYDFFEDIKHIGEDDRAVTALILANELIGIMHKVQKWMTVRKDLTYARYFLLKAAEPIAYMELCIRGFPNSRSSIQKAIDFNPEIMNRFYHEPMEHVLTEAELSERLNQLDNYIEEKIELFQRPVIEYLSDEQIKTASMIAKYIRVESHFIVDVLDYLSEKGVIEKASQIIKLTPKSRLSIEEIGYLYIS